MAAEDDKASDRLLSDSTQQGGAVDVNAPDDQQTKQGGVYKAPPVFYPPDTAKRVNKVDDDGKIAHICARYGSLLVLGIIFMSAICHISGFATEGWAYHDVYIYKMKFGLWTYQQCWDYTFLGGRMNCFEDYIYEAEFGDWKMDMKNIGNYRVYITGWIKASQALESLALVGYVITCGLIIGHVFSSEARENRNVEIAFVISSCITMLLALVGAITYAVNMMERCWYSSADCSMGYSFGLVIAGCILSIIAATLKVLEMVGMFKDYNRNQYDQTYKPGY